MKAYILIGGPLHGTIKRVEDHCLVVKTTKQRPFHFAITDTDPYSTDLFYETEDYQLRCIGIRDTKRRMIYLVLASLSDEEGLRLINEFESEDDCDEIISRHR